MSACAKQFPCHAGRRCPLRVRVGVRACARGPHGGGFQAAPLALVSTHNRIGNSQPVPSRSPGVPYRGLSPPYDPFVPNMSPLGTFRIQRGVQQLFLLGVIGSVESHHIQELHVVRHERVSGEFQGQDLGLLGLDHPFNGPIDL